MRDSDPVTETLGKDWSIWRLPEAFTWCFECGVGCIPPKTICEPCRVRVV